MNFIEQIFGVAPDRADGSLELMLLSIIVLFVSAVGLVQMRKTVVLQVSNADKFVAERLSCVLRLLNRKGCR